jgi:hypothetical protein
MKTMTNKEIMEWAYEGLHNAYFQQLDYYQKAKSEDVKEIIDKRIKDLEAKLDELDAEIMKL